MQDFLIIAGSYERLLYGVKLNGTDSTLTSEFIYPSHISCIKAVATGGRFLASGATDEHLKVYDLKLRKEVGTLMQHQGSITHLEFFQKSHLVSSSEDGTLCLYRVKDWEVLKTLRGHRGQVNSFCIHPSGKLMLSVGKDSTLCLWDLMRGLCVKTMKLKGAADKVIWNEKGTRYAVCQDRKVTITEIEDGEELYSWTCEQRIHAIQFTTLNNKDGVPVEVLIAAGEDKLLHFISADLKSKIKTLDINAQSRIKDFKIAVDAGIQYLITCTSDGTINVVKLEQVLLDESEMQKIESTAEYSTGCRLVCLNLVNLTKLGQAKVKSDSRAVEAQSDVESEFETTKTEKVTVTFEDESAEVVQESKKASKKRKFNKAKKQKDE